MKAKHVTIADLETAMADVNRQYNGNLEFDRLEANGKSVNFTLRVKSSSGPGHRLGFHGRKMAKACWHAHGDFFDALFAVKPDAIVISRGGPGAVVTKASGNWQDCNIGSQVQPLLLSQACECNH